MSAKIKNKSDKDFLFGDVFIKAGGFEIFADDLAAKLVVISGGQLERVEDAEDADTPKPETAEPSAPEEIETKTDESEKVELSDEDDVEFAEKAYQCQDCEKSFGTARALAAHRRIVHK